MKMSEVSAIKSQFKVTEVARIDTPEGMEGKDWHSYTIKRGTTEINGRKPGTMKKVTAHAKQVAEDLNLRCSGLGASPYAARRNNKS
jgi:hypothetical protein